MSDEIRWTEVCTLDDLWEGDMLDVEVDDEHVLLVHCPGGHIAAFQGVCPHQETLLVEGEFDGAVITCGAHLWEFDAATGAGINPEGARLFRYEVKVEGDAVYVGVRAAEDGRRYHRFSS